MAKVQGLRKERKSFHKMVDGMKHHIYKFMPMFRRNSILINSMLERSMIISTIGTIVGERTIIILIIRTIMI